MTVAEVVDALAPFGPGLTLLLGAEVAVTLVAAVLSWIREGAAADV